MKQNDLIGFLEDPDAEEQAQLRADRLLAAQSTPEAIAKKEADNKQKSTMMALAQQIMGQGLTDKWSGQGYGSAEANARDMGKILAGIGITDIKQFGKVPKYEPVQEIGKTYNGNQVYSNGEGGYLYSEPTNETDSEGNVVYRSVAVPQNAKIETQYGFAQDNGEGGVSYSPVDPSKVKTVNGQIVADTGQTTFGNKETGQAVPNTYSERQTGNFFGGTFEGKGNTGYGVQFDSQGNPIFYTQGASSSDLGNIAPLLSIASFIPGVAPFAQGLNALIAAKQGNILGAVAGAAGLGGMTEVANAARFAGALKSGDPLAIAMAGANAGGISDIGGVDLKDISKTIGAVKAIESGDPLAILRYGMDALPKGDGLTSSIGPGNMDEFRENLIPGYFQPGGEGYMASSGDGENVFDPTFGGTMPTGPGYYNEETGKFISDPLGGIQGPLGPETGNLDPNKEWEYNLVRPGVWANKDGEEIDVSYMPDRGTAQTGGEIMRNAGAMPGGGKKPAAAKPGAKPATPTARPGTTAPAGNPVVDAIANLANQQQNQQNALLNMMASDKNEVAKIKSFKELYGEDLFGGSYVPPSALGSDDGFSGMPMAMPMPGMGQEQDAGDDGFSNGGRVNNIDVDTLLQILRG
jgi:hypothetical protein